ncbi:hypothetical protein FQZ97_402010 [compost metagenome]
MGWPPRPNVTRRNCAPGTTLPKARQDQNLRLINRSSAVATLHPLLEKSATRTTPSRASAIHWGICTRVQHSAQFPECPAHSGVRRLRDHSSEFRHFCTQPTPINSEKYLNTVSYTSVQAMARGLPRELPALNLPGELSLRSSDPDEREASCNQAL